MQAPPSSQFAIAYSSISSNRPQIAIATLLPASSFSYTILTQDTSFSIPNEKASYKEKLHLTWQLGKEKIYACDD